LKAKIIPTLSQKIDAPQLVKKLPVGTGVKRKKTTYKYEAS
jgi:hypothetical protein